ncbi:regulator of sigma E protease [Enhydrobacter aerosaccus]|uniref:Zinc metalloprotease n=1 Tax=Enhydrobacter aerosaccus TaxID=225324 RepID=A0A1T4KYC2_9HYPH|nr:RIP metalloprotease RseP [Enhydrobacter aerosaccus]SJZ47442.1 regulator of sigma E protease [Enhydrobacter aerosaccus]
MHSIVSLFTTYLPYFILVLTLLVFVHEFGHYWVGRRFGIHAEVFSIGFGPELFGWTDRNGTRWKVSMVPLGGYVKFLGDSDGSSALPSNEPLSVEQRKRAFFTQPLYARAAVVLGGPAANILFAIVLLTGVFLVAGEPYSPPIVAVQPDGPAAKAGLRTGDEIVRLDGAGVNRFEDIQDAQFLYLTRPMSVEYRRGNELLRGEIMPQYCERTDRYHNTIRYGDLGIDELIRPVVGGFTADSPAEAAGLKVGDLLLDIDGKPVDYFSRIPELIGGRAGQPVVVEFDRDGQRMQTTVVPQADQVTDCSGATHPVGRLRIRPANVTEFRNHDLFGAAWAGVHHVWNMTTMFYTSMAQIATASRPVDELGGPIRIAKAAGEASYAGWTGILNLVIALSVVLGVFNLLPVPMLDGGHLAMYLYEAIRGRPLGLKAQELGLKVGFALVIGMALVATFNDIKLLLR